MGDCSWTRILSGARRNELSSVATRENANYDPGGRRRETAPTPRNRITISRVSNTKAIHRRTTYEYLHRLNMHTTDNVLFLLDGGDRYNPRVAYIRPCAKSRHHDTASRDTELRK